MILRPPGVPRPLADRLAEAAQARHFWSITAGLFLLLAVVLGIPALWLAFDLAGDLPAGLRACGLASWIISSFVVGFRYLWPLIRTPPSPLQTALLMEQANPEFNDALASAAEFLERRDGNSFHQATVDFAERLSRNMDFHAIIPSGSVLRGLLLLAGVITLLAALTATNFRLMPTAVKRFLHPWGVQSWPLRTSIVSLEARQRIALGESWHLRARLAGEIPEQAILQIQYPSGALEQPRGALEHPRGSLEHPQGPLVLAASIHDSSWVEFELDPSRISQNFEYRLLANDAATDWQHVTVAAPPKFTNWDGRPTPRWLLHHRRYTRQGTVPLPDGVSTLEAVAGTTVELHAATDRPIVAASLVYAGDRESFELCQQLAPLAVPDPLGALSAMALAIARAEPIPVTISGPERQRLHALFTPAFSGLHLLRFEDDTGVAGQRLFDLRTFPDPAPTAALRCTDSRSNSTDCVSDRLLPLEVRAADRIFGLRGMMLEYRHEQEPWQTLPWLDLTATEHAHAAFAGPALAELLPRPAVWQQDIMLSVASLRHASGTPPVAGDVVRLRAAATDWDDHTLGKEPGRSEEVELRLHTAQSLDVELQRRLAAQREPLRRIMEQQRAAAEAAQLGVLDASSRAQQEVRRLLSSPQDGLLARLAELEATARDNQLSETAATARLRSMLRDLGRVDDQRLPAIESLLADPQRAAARLPELAAAQERAARDFAAAEAELDRWASLAELQSEAHALSQQLRRAAAEAQRLQTELPPGAPVDQLAPEEQAALNRLAGQLDRTANQLQDLLSKANRVRSARQEAGADSEAERLARALQAASGSTAVEELRQAVRDVSSNRLASAAKRGVEAQARLDDFEAGLAGREASSAETLTRRRKQTEALRQIREDQEQLARQAQAAESPGRRQELADQQERLQRRTEALAEQLQADAQPAGAEALRQAADAMQQAAEQLAAGQPADAAQAQAKRVLEQAEQERRNDTPPTDPPTDPPSQSDDNDLSKRLSSFRDRQRAAVASFDRISAAARQARGWDRGLALSLVELSAVQETLAREVLAEGTKLADAPVFASLLEHAADNLNAAAVRLQQRKDDALTAEAFVEESETAADRAARQPMHHALLRLEQLAASVEARKQSRQENSDPPSAKQKPPPKSSSPTAPLSEPGASPALLLPQLKALRDWQAELRERTAAFHRKYPRPDLLTDDALAELELLEREQRAIAELFNRLREQLHTERIVPP